MPSSYCFLIVPTKIQNHLPIKHNLYSRESKNFDRGNFILYYFEIDWNNIIEIDKEDVNHSLSKFMERINVLFDQYMPLKKYLKNNLSVNINHGLLTKYSERM